MVLIPCILLACFSPGYLFPQMAARMSAPKSAQKSDAEKQVQPEGHESQQQTASGDESGPSDAQTHVEPAPTPVLVESKGKEGV